MAKYIHQKGIYMDYFTEVEAREVYKTKDKEKFKLGKDLPCKEVDALYQKYLQTKSEEDKWAVILARANMIWRYSERIQDIIWDNYPVAGQDETQDIFMELCLKIYDHMDTCDYRKFKSVSNMMAIMCNKALQSKQTCLDTKMKFIDEHFNSYEDMLYSATVRMMPQDSYFEMEDILEREDLKLTHAKALERVKRGLSAEHYQAVLKFCGEENDCTKSYKHCELIYRKAKEIAKGERVYFGNESGKQLRAEIKADKKAGLTIGALAEKYDISTTQVFRFLGQYDVALMLEREIAPQETSTEPQTTIVEAEEKVETGVLAVQES